MKILQLEETLRVFCKSKRFIQALYLFGSYCKGNATKNSDIDLAIIVDDNTDEGNIHIEEVDRCDVVNEKIIGKKTRLIGLSSLEAELKKITNTNIDLHYLGKDTQKIALYVAECNRLVYKRNGISQEELNQKILLWQEIGSVQ